VGRLVPDHGQKTVTMPGRVSRSVTIRVNSLMQPYTAFRSIRGNSKQRESMDAILQEVSHIEKLEETGPTIVIVGQVGIRLGRRQAVPVSAG
jgi:hypothetical protein